jgi:hypothetical protein
MKLKSIALFFCLSTTITYSTIAFQTSSDSSKTTNKKEMKTLINTNFKLKSWGISLAPVMQFGQMGKQSGLTAFVHLNQNWAIGMTMMSSLRKRDDMGLSENLQQKFGGLHLEYTPKPNALVHVSFPLTIGMIAQEKYQSPILYVTDPLNNSTPQRGSFDHNRVGDRDWLDGFDKSFGIQPGINVEVNLFKYAKVFGGVNYRFAMGKFANENIQGIGGQFGFRFGVFNKAIKK